MKLFEQFLSQGKVIESTKEKLPEGVLCRAAYQICSIGEKNRNNRVYEKSVWDKVMGDKDIMEKLKNRSLFFHAEHPTTTQSNTEKVAGVVTDLQVNEAEKKVNAVMEVLDTPYGRIVDTLLRAGCGIGVSTRADGELEEAVDEGGNKYSRVVPESYRFVTIDFTADPSTYGSEIPLSVERDIAGVIKKGLDNEKIDREFSTVLLEHMKAPEAVSLLESIRMDKHHKDCKFMASEKKCTKGCPNALTEEIRVAPSVAKQDSTEKMLKREEEQFKQDPENPNVGPLLTPVIPESFKSGTAVKIHERNGVVSHIFPRTQKCIVQFAEGRETVNIADCKVVKEEYTEVKMEEPVNEVIKKVGGKWQVQSHKGKNLGTYDSEEAAKKRLGQVEFFKHKNEDVELDEDETDEKYTTSSDKSGQPANAKAAAKVVKKSAAKNKLQEGDSEMPEVNEQAIQSCSKCGEVFNSMLQGSNPHKCKYDYKELGEKVKQFLAENKGKFINEQEAIDNLVKLFKIGENDAKEYIKENSAVAAMVNEKVLPSDMDKKLSEMSIRLASLTAERNQLVENYGKDAVAFTTKIDALNKQLTEADKNIRALNEEAQAQHSEICTLKEQNEQLAESHLEEVKTLNENITSLKESYAVDLKAVQVSGAADLKTVQEEREAEVKRINEEKQVEVNKLKETYQKDLIKFYVGAKTRSMGLSLHESILTLLESCKSVGEVDALIRKTQNDLRENLVQSAGIPDIVIESQSDPNPMVADIRNKVGIALKHFGI